MARTLTFTGELNWPLEDGKQASKLPLTVSLVYTSALCIEKVYSGAVVDEVVTLPMASAKFMLLKAKTNDISIKLNTGAAQVLKADDGFILCANSDGMIDSLKVTTTGGAVPATLQGYLFA